MAYEKKVEEMKEVLIQRLIRRDIEVEGGLPGMLREGFKGYGHMTLHQLFTINFEYYGDEGLAELAEEFLGVEVKRPAYSLAGVEDSVLIDITRLVVSDFNANMDFIMDLTDEEDTILLIANRFETEFKDKINSNDSEFWNNYSDTLHDFAKKEFMKEAKKMGYIKEKVEIPKGCHEENLIELSQVYYHLFKEGKVSQDMPWGEVRDMIVDLVGEFEKEYEDTYRDQAWDDRCDYYEVIWEFGEKKIPERMLELGWDKEEDR